MSYISYFQNSKQFDVTKCFYGNKNEIKKLFFSHLHKKSEPSLFFNQNPFRSSGRVPARSLTSDCFFMTINSSTLDECSDFRHQHLR